MKLLDKLFGRSPEAKSRPRASAEGITFQGLDDPALLEFIRNGQTTSANRMVRNMAALRSLSLISNGLGMLPISLYEAGSTRR
jgi:phage portal protein BeeE